MRILVIEDEQKIANAVKKGFEQESFAVDICYDGEQGLNFALDEPYDLIILDLMLPGKNGIEICQELRAKNIRTPILMLTAKSQVNDKVAGLNSGADDYLVKPFAFEELVARVRSLLRRPGDLLDSKLKCSDLTLNSVSFEVTRAGQKISLTQKEFALLEYLMRNQNKVITKNKIIANVWDYDADILPNTVEVYIGYLRQKIDKAFPNSPQLLKTKRGFGYVLQGNL